MPRRSSFLDVPESIRSEFNERLVRSGFADYDGLTEWLNAQLEAEGLELRVSRSATWRHGKQFEERLERMRVATEQAKALAEGADDDAGAMNEALIRLVQTRVFDVLMELGDDIQPGDLNKVALITARLTRASVKVKEWQQEVRQEIERKAAAAAEKVEALTGKGGLTQDVAAQIRAEILGIKVDG